MRKGIKVPEEVDVPAKAATALADPPSLLMDSLRMLPRSNSRARRGFSCRGRSICTDVLGCKNASQCDRAVEQNAAILALGDCNPCRQASRSR